MPRRLPKSGKTKRRVQVGFTFLSSQGEKEQVKACGRRKGTPLRRHPGTTIENGSLPAEDEEPMTQSHKSRTTTSTTDRSGARKLKLLEATSTLWEAKHD